ncbi:MAG: tetratricopeptide repeat protein [Bacteroidales bacterium]|jgi:predicted Zn-dependent protease|nr:tetratricopeptide repeat protein [Bacteroidales bacterium]
MHRFVFIVGLWLCCAVSFAQQGSTEQLAIEFLNNGETKKALKLFDEAYSKAPSPHLYNLYLEALLQKKDTKEAERLVRKHLRNFPNIRTTAVDLGYVYLVSGNKTKADKEFTNILERLPNNANQITEIAIALFNRNQMEFATQAFAKGRKILNDPQAFALDLAALYERANRIADMTNEYLVMLDYNPDILPYVEQRIQVVLANDTEKQATAEIRKTILAYIQKNPENRTAQEFWISLLLATEDFDTAFTFAKAYDKRFNNASLVLQTARIAQNSNSKIAEQAYQYLIAKGDRFPLYPVARMGLLSYYYQQIITAVVVDTKALLALEKEYADVLSRRPLSVESVDLIRDWAHISAFYQNDFEKADSLLNTALNMPNLPRNIAAQVKLDLADIYLFTDEVWESTLLYSQVEKEFKHDEIGFDAKLRNARLSYYIGEFEWSLAQLDVLRAATSKLIANDAMELSLLIRENNDYDSSYSTLRLFAHADLLIYQRKYDEALQMFDSIRKLEFSHSLHDDIQMKRAEVALKRGNPEEAVPFLEDIFTNYTDQLLADDALYLAARICEEQLKQPFKAMDFYERLILEHPSSLYIPDARKRFRTLRGS